MMSANAMNSIAKFGFNIKYAKIAYLLSQCHKIKIGESNGADIFNGNY